MVAHQERRPYVVLWRGDETVSGQIKMQVDDISFFLFFM
jgi:hypothetical protein